MDEKTIQCLNDINRKFYNMVADEFNQTRGRAWNGWNILFPYIQHKANSSEFSVLDIGCGNGRFGVYLANNLKSSFDYHGMDNNPPLLEYADKALMSFDNIKPALEQRDVVLSPPQTGRYDLVVLFGVIHHIPGSDNRRDFLHKMAERVKSGGLLSFACWRFYDHKRFKQRIIAWPDELTTLVEPNDYLLDWRRGGETEEGEYAQRYCHFVDDAEHAQLIAASGLQEVHTFRADGFSNDVNRYSILKKM